MIDGNLAAPTPVSAECRRAATRSMRCAATNENGARQAPPSCHKHIGRSELVPSLAFADQSAEHAAAHLERAARKGRLARIGPVVCRIGDVAGIFAVASRLERADGLSGILAGLARDGK